MAVFERIVLRQIQGANFNAHVLNEVNYITTNLKSSFRYIIGDLKKI